MAAAKRQRRPVNEIDAIMAGAVRRPSSPGTNAPVAASSAIVVEAPPVAAGRGVSGGSAGGSSSRGEGVGGGLSPLELRRQRKLFMSSKVGAERQGPSPSPGSGNKPA